MAAHAPPHRVQTEYVLFQVEVDPGSYFLGNGLRVPPAGEVAAGPVPGDVRGELVPPRLEPLIALVFGVEAVLIDS